MLKLLESIFGRSPAAASKYDPALIRKATDRLVEGTDPRLKAVAGYQEKLRPAVERTVEYVIDLVDSLTDPADIARANYLADPRLRAFFSSVEHIREVVSSSAAINEFLGKRGGVPFDPVHAMLAVRYEEQKSLGMKLVGETVRRDVMQQVFNFRGHQFVVPNLEEQMSRWELKRLAYDEMVSAALRKLVTEREKRNTARRERQLLEAKLRRMRAGRLGLSPAIEDLPQADTTSMEREIAQIEAELDKAPVPSSTLEDYVNVCAETLQSPEAHLRIRPISVTLDQMGRKVDAGSSAARTLSLQEVSLSDGERAILMPVRIDPGMIPPPRDFIKEARKHLVY